MGNNGRVITEAELKNEIKSGVKGGYFFYGEEDYLKSYYAAEFRRAVLDSPDGFGDFNHVVLDTDTFDGAALENALASLPMMSDIKLVEMRFPDILSWKEREKNEFIKIISELEEYPHSVFLITVDSEGFDEGNLPKNPSAMYKAVSKHMTVVNFAWQSEAKLKKWIARHLSGAGITADDNALSYLIQYCGRDMRNLDSELSKLTAYISYHKRNALTLEDIAAVCSPNPEEFAFELTNAIIAGDRKRAFNALLKYKQRKDDPIKVMASVSKTVSEMLIAAVILEGGGGKKEIMAAIKNLGEYKAGIYKTAVTGIDPDRLRASLDRCRKTDALLKSTTLGYIAIERFIATIPQISRIKK